jgi:hypothetical protein
MGATWLHHPAVQSLLLPVLLSVLCIGLLGLLRPRWAGFGVLPALLLSFGLLPGYHWPAAAAAEKLPWVVAVAALGAVLLGAVTGPGRRPLPAGQGVFALIAWLAASLWVAGDWRPESLRLILVLLGAVLLIGWAWALRTRPVQGSLRAGARAAAPGTAASAALAAAAFALAGWAAWGGSLLLAQLAAMLGSVGSVLALLLWRWPAAAPRPLPPVAVLMPLGLAWAVIALAVAWQALAATPTAAHDDDPYYEPAPR